MSMCLRAVLLVALACCIATAGAKLAADPGGKDPEYVCQGLKCEGEVKGIQDGSTNEVDCLLDDGSPVGCVYTGSESDECESIGDPTNQNKCTGKQKGNPTINCYKLYPNCKKK